MTILSVYETVMRYYGEIQADPHARYKSWEHCYLYFGNIKANDIACLHLAFYLASWGMYRGSSHILDKDYKIYSAIVELLLKYEALRKFKLTDGDKVQPIIELKGELTKELFRVTNKAPSDTLLSKIILGTLGCVPAYDRFVKDGLKDKGKYGSFSAKSLKEIMAFGQDHGDDIQSIKEKTGVEYTDMKIMDMYFWQLGSELPKNKALDKKKS